MTDITQEILEKIRIAQQNEAPQPSDAVSAQASFSNEELPCLQEGDIIEEIKDDAGNVIQRVPTRDGNIQGTLRTFNTQGQISQEIPYNQGIIHGLMKIYDENGTLTCTIPFKEGKKEGISTVYSGSQKTMETSFQNDIMHGPMIAYHLNGTVSVVAIYEEGVLSGELGAYDPQGALLKKETYKKGLKEGSSQTFLPDGTLYEEAMFQEDKPVAQAITYGKDKKPAVIKNYEEGKLVSLEIYDDNGHLMEKTVYPQNQNEISGG